LKASTVTIFTSFFEAAKVRYLSGLSALNNNEITDWQGLTIGW